MRRLTSLTLTALVLLLLLTAGCATYRLRPQSPDSDGHEHSETARSLFWGLVQETVPAPCQKGIDQVEVVRPFVYDLASVLTLGIWQPIEIVYWCSAGPSTPGKPLCSGEGP